jgi:hypothetical protein
VIDAVIDPGAPIGKGKAAGCKFFGFLQARHIKQFCGKDAMRTATFI